MIYPPSKLHGCASECEQCIITVKGEVSGAIYRLLARIQAMKYYKGYHINNKKPKGERSEIIVIVVRLDHD